MKIIKVYNSNIREFTSQNNYIPLSIAEDCNYYVVEDVLEGYAEVTEVPDIEDIVKGDFNSIIKYLSARSNEVIEQEICTLNEKIANSDYKIIKCYEYSLVGKQLPYDITALHAERQPIRDEINKLQAKIKPEKTWEELDNIIVYNKITV